MVPNWQDVPHFHPGTPFVDGALFGAYGFVFCYMLCGCCYLIGHLDSSHLIAIGH
jgi:hypothetical protein